MHNLRIQPPVVVPRRNGYNGAVSLSGWKRFHFNKLLDTMRDSYRSPAKVKHPEACS